MMLLLIVLLGIFKERNEFLFSFKWYWFFFVRPRGLAGTLLVILKIAGALAEQGKNMSEIVDICQQVRGHLRTIGLSASGVQTPGQQKHLK